MHKHRAPDHRQNDHVLENRAPDHRQKDHVLENQNDEHVLDSQVWSMKQCRGINSFRNIIYFRKNESCRSIEENCL